MQYYGANGSALALFRSYLTERWQYVDYNETSSSLEHISTGVPQGSILRTSAIYIYINDIVQSSPYFNFITYADGTTLFGKSAVQIDIENIEKELKHVTECLKMNKLSLNIKKTKAMLFHMPQKKSIVPKIKINGTIIAFVDNFNFLGINLNKHLNWNPHVKIVSNKLVKTVGVLNILKKTLPLNVLRIIYNALILPHLNYGILAWGHEAKRLNLIQKRAVRILTASKYNSHTEPLFKQTNILKVSAICTLKLIKFYNKLINKQLPQYFNSFTCEANSDIHGYNTRSRNKLHTCIPKTNHNFAQNNLRYRIIQTLNKLPDNVFRKMYTHSIYGLTSYAKKYFISNYKT